MPKDQAERDLPGFVPNSKEETILKLVFEDLNDFRRAKEKKYRFLGDRSPQRYWDEQEKRFTTYTPPKDVTENDWQANIVMGITRNAVLSQVSKTGMRVPECHIQSFTEDGFVDDERSRIYQNAYKWSLRRENADKLQQYVSIGAFIRGNACLYEGFEDKEIEVEIISDTDPETGEVKSEKEKVRTWGPKRQIVPLHEIFFRDFFVNDIQDQSKVIWKQVVPYAVAKAEFGKYKNWKFVVPGNYSIGTENESFFYTRGQMSGKQVEIVRWYGNPWKGGPDRHYVCLNGIPVLDIPLPFNHKRLPFSWGKNNPFSDKFMLGMGVPFMAMDNQDVADAIMNMALDKNLLSMQKPIMTDDPDPTIRTYLSPGSIMQYTPGSQWQLAPIEGVTGGEFQMFQLAMSQAKEFTGAYGGGSSSTPRGGKVTARQALMQEEETKRLLGISMTNLENIEKDLCALRISNLKQFLPGSGQKIDVGNATLSDGRKGRFVAFFTENLKKAMALEAEDKTLSNLELTGELIGKPTEAKAIAPEWFDNNDRVDVETVPESSYLSSKSLEEAQAMEDYVTFSKDPMVDHEELLRMTLKKKRLDANKLIKVQAPQAPEGQPPPGAPPGLGGPSPGPLTRQMGAQDQAKALTAMTG